MSQRYSCLVGTLLVVEQGRIEQARAPGQGTVDRSPQGSEIGRRSPEMLCPRHQCHSIRHRQIRRSRLGRLFGAERQ
jgi:hypothetical protein